MKLTTLKTASLVTALCLTTALTISSCGKKDKAETTTETTKTETTTPATGASTAPATGASTAPATSASTAPAAGGADKALSATEKAQLTPVKAALVMASTAIKGGDVTKAKTQFAKVSSLWPTVQPIVKSKAGASYPAIESGIEMVKTAMSAPTPDKAKAGEGLTAAINGMNTILSKK
jgi:iron uptake system EfeUOB component EfeO/EfeM